MLLWAVLIFGTGMLLLGCVEVYYRLSYDPARPVDKRNRNAAGTSN